MMSNLRNKNFTVDTNAALRYLGYRGKPADAETLTLIQDCSAQLEGCVTPRSLLRRLPAEVKDGSVTISGVTFRSRDLSEHLKGCMEAVLFAATLGTPADTLQRRYGKTDMARAVILHACEAAYVESYCDFVCGKLSDQIKPEGLYLRPRYSPGYGDFDIRHQADLLGILDAPKKIGLTMTDSFMLAPSKSVTAVIGLTKKQKAAIIAKCMECKSINCPFRKD